MLLKKNTILGKINLILLFVNLVIFSPSIAQEKIKSEGTYVEIKVLDKVSSKNTQLKLEVGKEKKFQNLMLKIIKCINSEFDDNPEVTAYMQVQDITLKNNDKVFVFNGWTFSSSPSITLFDHPVYDIWLIKCY